jgi:hypothetical protein
LFNIILLLQQFSRPFDADSSFGYQLCGDAIHCLTLRAGGDGYLPGVQRHVAALDAFSCQRADCGQVLRQPHRRHNLAQFTRALDAENLERNLRGRVRPRRPADDADCQRQLEAAKERRAAALLCFSLVGCGFVISNDSPLRQRAA